MRLRVHPARGPLGGIYRPPGDKSISHRAAILGGLADGETVIRGFLDSADTRATLNAMVALGAQVEAGDDLIRMSGGGLTAPDRPLDLGNSGTGMRLLCGALAGRPELFGASVRLEGDHSLSSRPMTRIIDPLVRMGGRIESVEGYAPLTLHPARLHGIDFQLPVASAQVKSALLLAGMAADGETRLIEPGVSRDHTERMLPAFGVELHDGAPGIAIAGDQRLTGTHCEIPGDLSSAAFVMAAALLVPDSEIRLERVGLNPTRDGVLRVIESMGGVMNIESDLTSGGEPVGDLTIRSAGLQGVDIAQGLVPLAIDEFPVLMALAATAEGRTRIRGAAELRVKESDRLAVMCRELARLGVTVDEQSDGATIYGGNIRGGRVNSAGDHRIAMSLAVLGLAADAPVEIDSAEWIRTSYPAFVEDMRALGAEMEWEV